MEGSIEVSGVVLSSMPVGEYDRRLLLLTREKGKISAFARGARKPGSSLLAAARPCTFGIYQVYQGRSSYTVQNMKPVRFFEELSMDIEGMTYASYFLELADYYSRENVEGTEMINLLFVAMKALLNEHIDNRLVRVIYELRAMGINGEAPQVFHCGSCGKELAEGEYSRIKSSLFCPECALTQPAVSHLSETVVYTMCYILTAPLSKLFTFKLSETVEADLRKLISAHMKRYIEKDFHSLAVLDAIST